MVSSKDFRRFAKGHYPTSMVEASISGVYDELFKDRVIILDTAVDEFSSNLIKAQLLYLDSISNDDIYMYIDSPGGGVYTGLGIIDTMNYINSDVSTINTGIAASMAAVILASGARGKRKSLKHCRTMLHQPLSYASGQASDIIIDAIEIGKIRTDLYNILVTTTGKTYKKIEHDCDRDFFLSSEETLKYGIIDEIIYKKSK